MLRDMEDSLAASDQNRSWRTLYKSALSEPNPAQQRRKIDLANAAIHERLYQLADGQVQGGEEQKAIVDALQTMRSMQGMTSILPGEVPPLRSIPEERAS
jgi:hypothetical protein